MSVDDLATQLCKRLDSLKTARQVHELVWKECFLLTDPVRASGFDGFVMNANEISAAIAKIMDSTAIDAKRTLASSVQSGMTPANSLWFKMQVANQSDDEAKWLEEASELLWENIHNANFDSESGDCMDDCMGAGWFGLFIDEDRENGGLHFEHWALSSIYCAASKPGGMIDTVFRPFRMSAEAAVSAYSKTGDSLPDTIAERAKLHPDEMFDFLWAIYPRRVSVPNAVRSKNLPIASVTIAIKDKAVVRESGFHEMPVVVARWKKIPDSVYATGPVLDALPDIRSLNNIKTLEYANLDMAVSGMWIAEDDGVLNPRSIRVGPRKIIVANSVDSMKPLQPATNFQVAFTEIEKLQGSIRKILLADQLQPQDGPAMTATEVHVRVDLVRQLLGPIYGRLQAEYLQPLITRCFGVAYRAGIFAPPPDSLVNRDFTIRYVSPLARAQKLEEVSAIERLYADAAQMATIDATILDNIDNDEAVRILSKDLGVPMSMIRTPDQVQKLRGDRQAAQLQQQAQQKAIETNGNVQQGIGLAAANQAMAA
jgi:hypothetical protein